MTDRSRPKVIILGAGFGGIAAAKRLARAPVDVLVIDKRNHHLFQPLLYQVATAGLSPADIAWPIRNMLSGYPTVSVLLADATGVDRQSREVITDQGRHPFDYLIVATGARHSYFGHPDWEPHAPGLKRIVDAVEIRKRVLMAFERAEAAHSEEDRDRQLTFVIVGAGPTGVEMAGAIAELARHALSRDFRHIDPSRARVLLVDAGPRVLAAFPEELSNYTKQALETLGVDVVLNEMVSVEADQGVRIGGRSVASATTIWAAGVAVPRLSNWFDTEADRTGRIIVAPDLSIPGNPSIFVVGDAAHVAWRNGTVPGIAPAAKQGGDYVAEVIRARVTGKTAPKPFAYRHKGDLATIGRNAAVVDLGWLKLKGSIAWWFWGIAHIYFLIGVRAPLLVAIQWFWSYLTYGRGARLITGAGPSFDTTSTKPDSMDALPPRQKAG